MTGNQSYEPIAVGGENTVVAEFDAALRKEISIVRRQNELRTQIDAKVADLEGDNT